jgi:hypothetical protein
MVKSHVASDISCTFPADSVPPVPALLQILAREHKSHQPKTATFVRGLVWRASYISNRPPTLYCLFHDPLHLLGNCNIRLHKDRLAIPISLTD